VPVLTLPVTVTAAGTLKLDSMSEVDITTAATTAYQYTINYELQRDTGSLAIITVEKDVDNASAAERLLSEIPNMTWVDTLTPGAYTYVINISVTGTNLAGATASTSALNAIVFSD
jgi:hypothetical protein